MACATFAAGATVAVVGRHVIVLAFYTDDTAEDLSLVLDAHEQATQLHVLLAELRHVLLERSLLLLRLKTQTYMKRGLTLFNTNPGFETCFAPSTCRCLGAKHISNHDFLAPLW